MQVKPVIRWGALWHSKVRRRGDYEYTITEFLLQEDGIPVLFRTRKGARGWIRERYGYIKDRADLRKEPHGWRVPRAVKVEIRVITK